jgi:hypothetical protein
MRHVHSLGFDDLEARKLLSKAAIAGPHTTPAVIATPIELNGSLAIDNNAASQTTNADGGTTTMTPVTGRLDTLGKVHGVWSETIDPYGDIEGLDALRLRGPKGMIVLEFNNASPGPAHKAAHGAVYYTETQVIGASSGGYAGSTETGSIELYPNSGRSEITNFVLHTRGS